MGNKVCCYLLLNIAPLFASASLRFTNITTMPGQGINIHYYLVELTWSYEVHKGFIHLKNELHLIFHHNDSFKLCITYSHVLYINWLSGCKDKLCTCGIVAAQYL